MCSEDIQTVFPTGLPGDIIAEHTLHIRSLYQGLYQNLTMSEQDLDIFASSMSANSEELTDEC